jgi:GDSL-like Lipase/Acylhydrolase
VPGPSLRGKGEQMPLRMHTVVVFGDSLSDIGKKWTTKSGRMARATNQMYVSPTGRFSDCRNWTDFMFEAATGSTMIVGTAEGTIALSGRHTSLQEDSRVLYTFSESGALNPECFRYANYAEGGACGDTPASKAAFLGTFKDQVDAFENDCKVSGFPLGNTLFIIWFGANDLYTAKRKAAEMGQVAQQIASTQRKRLDLIVRNQNQRTMGATLGGQFACKFIFVDLCRPLTSVRYSMRLKVAEDKVKSLLGATYVAAASPMRSLLRAGNTLAQADKWGPANEVELLRAQVEVTKNLEHAVLVFNSILATIAHRNGDRVAEVGGCVSEDTIRKLVQGNYGPKEGVMGAEVTEHVSRSDYIKDNSAEYIATVDEVHPTDQMYRLLWLEIYEQIKRSGCTFGKLSPVASDTPLAVMSGPSQQTELAFAAVMNELGQSPQDRLTKTGL